jgi:hypothetical protein
MALFYGNRKLGIQQYSRCMRYLDRLATDASDALVMNVLCEFNGSENFHKNHLANFSNPSLKNIKFNLIIVASRVRTRIFLFRSESRFLLLSLLFLNTFLFL